MYKIITTLTEYKFIEKISDKLSIPMSDDNTDYKEYLKWVAEGNVAEEWSAE